MRKTNPICPAAPGGPPSTLRPRPRQACCAKQSQFAIFRPSRWTRQPPPYAGHTLANDTRIDCLPGEPACGKLTPRNKRMKRWRPRPRRNDPAADAVGQFTLEIVL